MLMNAGSFTEFLEARSRSIDTIGWTVDEDYTIEDGVVHTSDGSRIKYTYLPAGRPELPSEFAKIAYGSAEDVLGFVQKYGLLGQNMAWGNVFEMAGAKALKIFDEFKKADSISWVLSHAAAVDLVLKLSNALVNKPDKLKTMIDTLTVTDEKMNRIVFFKLPCRGYPNALPGTVFIHDNPDELPLKDTLEGRICRNDPREIALYIIRDILDANLSGIQRSLTVEEVEKKDHVERQLGFTNLFRPNNLLDSIYWMLTDAVVSGRVKTCEGEWCGKIFIADNAKRRFCPPTIGQEISPCMSRDKQKRYRKRKTETK